MTKLYFRVLVLIPVVALIAAITGILVGGQPDWPPEAMQYLAWFQGTPPSTFEYWVARLGLLALLGLIASSVGVLFFWSPARYAYLGFLALAVACDVAPTPVLVGMPDVMLDNIATLFFGVCLALMFTQPCSGWFARNEQA